MIVFMHIHHHGQFIFQKDIHRYQEFIPLAAKKEQIWKPYYQGILRTGLGMMQTLHYKYCTVHKTCSHTIYFTR